MTGPFLLCVPCASPGTASMETNISASLRLLITNRTGHDGQSPPEGAESLLDFRILNVALVSLALIIVTVTAIICTVSYHRRRRQYRRAQEYENAVRYDAAISPIHVTGIKRVLSLHKPLVLMRKQERARHSSQVYFIYDNPVMALAESQVQELREPLEDTTLRPLITSEVRATGVLLNPRVFYV